MIIGCAPIFQAPCQILFAGKSCQIFLDSRREGSILPEPTRKNGKTALPAIKKIAIFALPLGRVLAGSGQKGYRNYGVL
jgi:hypothetical protein